jgi:hypothetical protein
VARRWTVIPRCLPEATEEVPVGGGWGYLYPIVTEFGDRFDLCAVHDGALWQVYPVQPRLEGQYEPHEAHVYPDGRVCLTEQVGASTLEEAFARSALWANGMSAFLRTGVFPF